MRFTRRHLEAISSAGLCVVSLATTAGIAMSCGGEDDVVLGETTDDASSPEAGEAPEAGVDPVDASPLPRASGKSDAGPLPVVCETTPCATALVTTLHNGFCALLQDGTVACWGANERGQLGRGADGGTIDSPVAERVVGLSNVVALHHTCAIDDAGATWCWGTGPFLQTAAAQTRELVARKLPIPPVTAVDVQAMPTLVTACAVADGGVLCWGMNANGQIAVPEAGANPTAPMLPQPVAVPEGAPVRRLFVGNAAFVLREDGTLWSWGANALVGRVSSLSPDPYPKPVELAGVTSVDVVNDEACVTAEGIAYCWGAPVRSSGVPVARALPEALATPEPVVQIATTTITANNPQRWCASGVSGAVYCWGNNASGQAGDGTQSYAIQPVKVAGLPGPAAQVKTVPRATCALLTNGKVYCWGDNAFGQLGDGRLKVPSLVPQEVVLP